MFKAELKADTLKGLVYIISTLEQRLSVTLKKILPPSWFAAILGSYYKL